MTYVYRCTLKVFVWILSSFLFSGVSYALQAADYFPEADTTIDLIVLYSDNVADNYDVERSDFSSPSVSKPNVDMIIQHLISLSNQIYRASNISLKLRLAHSRRIYYNWGNHNQQALNDMTNHQYGFEDIPALRQQYGGDMVVFLRGYTQYSGGCGLAWVTDKKDHMYSVVNAGWKNGYGCSDLGFVHELGHNMGLNHSARQGSEGLNSYALGYGRLYEYSTIMASTTYFGVDKKTYAFSNPRQWHCGKSRNLQCGSYEQGDAVRQINQVKAKIAGFYPSIFANRVVEQSQNEPPQYTPPVIQRSIIPTPQSLTNSAPRQRIKEARQQRLQARQHYLSLRAQTQQQRTLIHTSQNKLRRISESIDTTKNQILICSDEYQAIKYEKRVSLNQQKSAYHRYSQADSRYMDFYYAEYEKAYARYIDATNQSYQVEQRCLRLREDKLNLERDKSTINQTLATQANTLKQMKYQVEQARILYDEKRKLVNRLQAM